MTTQQDRQEVENIVKDLIRNKLASILNDTDIKERGIARHDVIESYLTDIMALGYNDNNLDLSVGDIWELQSQMPWVNTTKKEISKRVEQTLHKFKKEADSFNLMVKGFANGNDKKTIIDNVKKALG